MCRTRLFHFTVPVLIAMSASSAAWPQEAASTSKGGAFARLVILRPKAGQTQDFEAGYKRHLEWHRAEQDTWTWFGWTFVLGERLGLFMDGTFGHTAADFDAAVKPAEDAADNRINVTPYADFLSHGIYERLDRLSHGTPLPDASAFLTLHSYQVVPGQEAAFESALARALDTLPSSRFTCYRLRLGGSVPQFVLMRTAGSFAAAAALPIIPLPPGLVQQVHGELLRFQPSLSYQP